jgi:hypothetical protein
MMGSKPTLSSIATSRRRRRGYDPDAGKYSPGMYLGINALVSKPAVKSLLDIDFGAGEGDWKVTLSDHSWYEAPVQIFAPTFQGLYLNLLITGVAMINLHGKKISKKANLLARVKKKPAGKTVQQSRCFRAGSANTIWLTHAVSAT